MVPPASVRRLEWFTDGFYSYQERADTVAITDLRMGFHPEFVFSFDIARRDGDTLIPVEPSRVAMSAPRATLMKGFMAEIGRTFHSCPA